MDFVHGDARLIKPFSVETEHVQASLMSGETGGGTPFTDALGFARRLLEQRHDSPLVIITDGKPGSADDYQQKLQQTYAPVCGLTHALNTPCGQAPERAKDVEPSVVSTGSAASPSDSAPGHTTSRKTLVSDS